MFIVYYMITWEHTDGHTDSPMSECLWQPISGEDIQLTSKLNPQNSHRVGEISPTGIDINSTYQ